ncbi:hypothetical protein OPV22_007102 [Ensete ventricosum]|nr:hypothetical protein OPV22_007102 [Ensete ventricosum]RWW30723.1 hypothetical protein GW17_00004699 [Ensete ventricosum]RWW48395.1 hypothetical protein BHE74_00045528 [Ensete ventricosum]RZS23061.1 hypothetical protein BHM03_00055914 [Ensete ventricosum]
MRAPGTVVAEKGHFVVYTVDDARFTVPLAFLKSRLFQELLKVSEEEFGLPGDGPITLACSAVSMEYILSLLGRRMSGDVERALLASIIDTDRAFPSAEVGCPFAFKAVKGQVPEPLRLFESSPSTQLPLRVGMGLR